MNCIIYITLKKNIVDIDNLFTGFFGNNNLHNTFISTSLNNIPALEVDYFFGIRRGDQNILFSEFNDRKIKIFIENINWTNDNINTLIRSSKRHFKDVYDLLIRVEVGVKEVNSTINSGVDEILIGKYDGFWKRVRNKLPSVPLSIYVSGFTLLIALLSANTDKVCKAIISLGILLIAFIFYLLVNSLTENTDLKYNYNN